MPVSNSEIAKIFTKVADLLDIQGANPFRVRAYRNAARTVEGLGRSAADMAAEGKDLATLKGIGHDLAGKILQIVETRSLPLLEELEKQLPGELSRFMDIPGLGPKKVAALHRELGITTLDRLGEAARQGRVAALAGFGEKTEKAILAGIEQLRGAGNRIRLSEAEESVAPLVKHLEKIAGVGKVTVAGSFRRRRETVGDIDILVTARADAKVMEGFAAYEEVGRVVAQGKTRSTVVLRSGLQVDLRAVPQASYGAALHYFTGSKAHNIAVRKLGVEKGLKINEYGVYKGRERTAGRTEEEVYAAVGLRWIEPELREDRGEIEASRKGRLPKLVTLEDIRGDLHTHTKATDGRFSLEEMAAAAKELGYTYMANTEHSRHVAVTGGLDEKALARHLRDVDRLNGRLRGFTVLKGIEMDILEDGSLDLDGPLLDELDIVVGAVHSKLNLPGKRQTERIIRAMDNPHFNVLAHPTERLIGRRAPYEVDLEKLIAAAAVRGCFLEINANPERLDLDDLHARRAKEAGVKVAISTDAHSRDSLAFMRFGVGQARRGWLEAVDVINTRSLEELRTLLRRR